MDEKLERLRVFKVNTPIGPRNLTYVYNKKEGDDYTVCEFCSYFNICSKLPHPEDPENPEKTFLDFCYNATSDLDKGPAVGDFIPKEGTIEENLTDVADPYKKLALDEHEYVKLGSVIDTVCADVCPEFDPSHCNCGANNKFCILRQLFKNKKKADDDGQ